MATQSAAFQQWYDRYQQSGDLGNLRVGIGREELQRWFGDPDDIAKGFRRQPLTGIWRYDVVEFHFSVTGKLYLVYSEQPDLVPRVILGNLTE